MHLDLACFPTLLDGKDMLEEALEALLLDPTLVAGKDMLEEDLEALLLDSTLGALAVLGRTRKRRCES